MSAISVASSVKYYGMEYSAGGFEPYIIEGKLPQPGSPKEPSSPRLVKSSSIGCYPFVYRRYLLSGQLLATAQASNSRVLQETHAPHTRGIPLGWGQQALRLRDPPHGPRSQGHFLYKSYIKHQLQDARFGYSGERACHVGDRHVRATSAARRGAAGELLDGFQEGAADALAHVPCEELCGLWA